MKMTKTKVTHITNNKWNKHGKMFVEDKFRYDRRKKVASGDYYGGDIMNNDYLIKSAFEQHEKHMDTKFKNVDETIKTMDENIKSLKEEVKQLPNSLTAHINLTAENKINEKIKEINDNKITKKRFWIGIAIPAILVIIGWFF